MFIIVLTCPSVPIRVMVKVLLNVFYRKERCSKLLPIIMLIFVICLMIFFVILSIKQKHIEDSSENHVLSKEQLNLIKKRLKKEKIQ